MTWRDNLRPASFRGAAFHVETTGKAGGRRGILHEFPHRDDPKSEDLGRRGRRFTIQAYIIGGDFQRGRDALEAAMDAEGPGLLVHPTKGEFLVQPDVYSSNETRERGGFVEFELGFFEAGSQGTAAKPDTQQQVVSKADDAGQAAATSADADLKATDVPLPPARPAGLGVETIST